MKKSLLNLGKALSKFEQKCINGGFSEDCPNEYICYGISQIPSPISISCGTCEEYNALPQHCQNRVLTSCF